jgi:hypothetical protein
MPLPIRTKVGNVGGLAAPTEGVHFSMHASFERSALRLFCTAFVAVWLFAPRPAEARPAYVHWMTSQPTAAPPPTDSLDGGSDAPADADADADAGEGGGTHPYIPDQGGPVITQVNVAAVFWSNRVDPTVVAKIGGLYATLVSGSFMHLVSEYSTPTQTIGSYGTVAGTFTITPNNTNTTLTDADIYTELAQQIAAGNLPPADANTVFMVHLPPGVGINDPRIGVSCVPNGFCAYHKSNGPIIYGLIPDFSLGGCAPGPPGCTQCCGDRTAFENVSMVSSHELMEAVTDPKPFDQPAWINVLAGEIGDLCNFSAHGESAFTTVVARDGTIYQGQKGFSNAAYLAHMGTPVGCVDYPTTLCCNDAQTNCTWLANGSTVCPNPTGNNPDAYVVPNGIVLTAPTVGGFGSATMTVTRKSINSYNAFPLGITDFIGPAAGVTSPTMNVMTDVVQLGDANACFAFVTNVTQHGITQCLPEDPAVSCTKSGQHIENTPSGPLCCTRLNSQPSPDGQQLCAGVSRLDPPPPAMHIPAIPSPAIALCAALLLGLGAAIARKRAARS